MNDSFGSTVTTARRDLTRRRDAVTTPVAGLDDARQTRHLVDQLLIATCRHVHAVCGVVLPTARTSLPDGPQRVHGYVLQCRRVERAVSLAKRRLYGGSTAAATPWPEVWSALTREIAALGDLERLLADELTEVLDADRSADLADRFTRAVLSGPSRPHPHSRHTGRLAPLVHGLWARADRFWDVAEGRPTSGPEKKFRAPTRFPIAS
jgi:hypothetical protein